MSEVRLVESSGLKLVIFEPSLLGLAASPKGNGQYTPVRLSEVMADPLTLAALDGPMFHNCDAGASYASSDCVNPRFAELDKGVAILEPSDRGEAAIGVYLSVVDGRAEWSVSGPINTQASVGVQMYPSLVIDGRVPSLSVTGSNGQREGRAGVLGFANGEIAFAVGTDTLAGFGQRCRQTGAVWGGYTDGGGSTALAMRNEDGTVRKWGASENRPVAVFLVARKPVAPSLPATVISAAPTALVVGLMTALVVGGVFYVKDRYGDRLGL